MRVYNKQNIIPAGTVMNATINSSAMELESIVAYSIQIVFAGTPTGNFKLQSSCDPNSNGSTLYAPTNWTDVASSTLTVSAAGNVEWDWSQVAGYNWVRVVYTDTSSGSSTATISSATLNAKGI